jgi:hypothetical protein
MTRFTPKFQSANGDASIGTENASALGCYCIVGHMLTVWTFFELGTGGTVGTGGLLPPLPLGFTPDDIDAVELPGQFIPPSPPDPGVQETIIPIDCIIGQAPSLQASTAAFIEVDQFTDDTPSIATIDVVGTLNPASGDTLAFWYTLPLKEPALPG